MDAVKSGIPELDKLLGGGLGRGKAYLVEATAGTKTRFITSAFCKQGYLDGELCRIDSLDDSYSEVIDLFKDGGFDAAKAATQGKLLILDFGGDVIYGSEVSGPYLSKSSHGTDIAQFENLCYVAWEETNKLKANANGLRVAVHGLSGLIRDYGLQRTLKYIASQVAFLKRQGAILIVTMNPDMVNATDLATIEDCFDGIIELTVREEKMKFQRYIRVKNSPISSFRQERLPYEIVGGNTGISIGSKITEDFESFKANIRMTAPGIIDILGDRSSIDTALIFGNVHKLIFEALGYEEGYNLICQVGIQTSEAWIRPYLDKLEVDISDPHASFTELAEEFAKYPTLRGYGVLELIDIDLKRKVVRFRLQNSQVAQLMVGYGKPVDAYIAGSLIAGARLVFGRNTVCRETMCVAKGDDHCEFEINQAEPTS
jgi:KaiC/GvpD/RAD55 family RecA-like ATPase